MSKWEVKMRAVVQRVREATVTVEGCPTGRIGPGMVVLLGIGREDGEEAVNYLAEKLVALRIFDGAAPDSAREGRRVMDRSIAEIQGEVLLVSQFTLYGDCRRGRRPSFDESAPPQTAQPLYRRFADRLRELGFQPQEGVFGARMELYLVNDGPVTMLLDSERRF